MTQHVERQILQDWLDTGQPVTVVDIRRDDDRSQWAIPGSLATRCLPTQSAVPASALFASLNRLRQLPPETIVLAGHTGEPIAFDGHAVSATLKDVTPWLAEWLTSESGFVNRVTSNVSPTPPNFVRIVELNEAGEFPAGDPTDLEAGAN
jgi:hypothetical protein